MLGYQATIDSVEILVAVLRERWDALQGHTPITAAQLDRAVAMAKRLSRALGERENGVNRGRRARTRNGLGGGADGPAIDADEPTSPATPMPFNGGPPFTS